METETKTPEISKEIYRDLATVVADEKRFQWNVTIWSFTVQTTLIGAYFSSKLSALGSPGLGNFRPWIWFGLATIFTLSVILVSLSQRAKNRGRLRMCRLCDNLSCEDKKMFQNVHIGNNQSDDWHYLFKYKMRFCIQE